MGLQSLIAESFKFLTSEVEKFYYVLGEKKDQLCLHILKPIF